MVTRTAGPEKKIDHLLQSANLNGVLFKTRLMYLLTFAEPMTEKAFFDISLIAWLALAIIIAVALRFINAPYGRHARSGWGPTIPSMYGWFLMELPAVTLLPILLIIGTAPISTATIALLLIWEVHYLQRTLIYPVITRRVAKALPLSVVGFGILFNLLNGYFNGRYLFEFSGGYPVGWLIDPRFIIGAALFVLGLSINLHADYVLRHLRQPGETGYKIPQGGLYRLISCPNYFGEFLEWCGWAIATWSLPGLAFALWTAANLFPRALAHHRWYIEKFPDYPKNRKAVIPFIL